MSYILDALRKAEAERERGSVPNIHAQPAFAGAPARGARPRSRVWIAVAVVGVLLVIAAALPWFFMADRSAVPAPVAAAPAPVVAPTPVPMTMPASAAAAPAKLPAPTTTPPAAAATAAAPPVQLAPVPVRKPRPAPAVASAATVAAAASATEERVYAMNELPDDIRRQLPGLSVGGSMYSTTPASRLVIVNGQVLHEGDRLTPELVLQQIRLKTAVFAFKGYRFTITF
jgi:general secretion pathway protein B